MVKLFTAHPHSIGETYFQHFIFASKFGLQMMAGGFACFLHAIFPFVFVTTGSDFLFKLIHEFVARMPADDARVRQLAEAIESRKQHAAK